MNGGALPPLIVCVAFAIAIADATSAVRLRLLLALIVAAAAVAFAPIPAAWTTWAHLGCWLSIVACGAGAYVPNALGSRAAIGLALAGGAAAGAVIALANRPSTIALLPLVAVLVSLAARAAARRLPIARKVVSSWLIAIALLSAILQMLPLTPGYLPDHLE